MPELGKKYTCYSCHTKFYDLGKPVPVCPKCGADQRDADEAPVVTSTRGRRAAAAPLPVVEEPADEPDFGAEGDAPAAPAVESDDEEEIVPADDREEEAEDEEEDEEY
jgi:hypothetical protein